MNSHASFQDRVCGDREIETNGNDDGEEKNEESSYDKKRLLEQHQSVESVGNLKQKKSTLISVTK